MYDEDTRDKLIIGGAIALSLVIMVVGLWLTAPTEEDIQRCVDNTNYTYEQCKHELSI